VTNTGMYDRFYKDQLYPIQDKVLALIGNMPSPFYLTGGTALSRFLLHHRYSDDLDFFVNRSPRFHEDVDKVYETLIGFFPFSKITVRQDSYVRIMITDQETSLKLEFVNDVGHRVGEVSRVNAGLQIDSWENILSNKVTALARLAGKDYVDVLFLAFK
jgi:predicted nucleotidyltransferase component of viral defense system